MTERETALAAEVQAILDEAEAVDAAEDQLYGDARGDELPPELRTREGQLARTREAKAALEAKARERTGNQAAVPAPKAQRNFTDPQSRIIALAARRLGPGVQRRDRGHVTRRYARQTPDALGRRAAEALARAGLVAS